MASCHGTPLKRVWLSLLHSFPSANTQNTEIPLRLLFRRLNSPSSLSFSLYDTCSSSFITFAALYWTGFNMSMSLLYWIAKYWTQNSRCVSPALNRGEGRPPSTCWQHCLKQPRMPVVFPARSLCWLMVPFLPTRTPRSFLPSCFSASSSPACLGGWSYSFSWEALAISLCWTSQGSCLSRSFWTKVHSSVTSIISLVFLSSLLAEDALCPIIHLIN